MSWMIGYIMELQMVQQLMNDILFSEDVHSLNNISPHFFGKEPS